MNQLNNNDQLNNQLNINEMIHEITIDFTKRVIAKPQPAEIGRISKNLKTKTQVGIKGFANNMAPNGYTWCPAIFNGKRNNKNWVSQSVFALDFDDGMSPEAVIKRLKDFNITPNVIYTSFSDSPELRKYRVVFFLDKIVEDKKIAKFIILNLMNIFPEADKACKDYARMFYSGKEVLHIDETVNSYDEFVGQLNIVQIAADGNRTRKIQNVQKLALNAESNNIYIANGVCCQKTRGVKSETKSIAEIKDFDFAAATTNCRILSDFFNGVWLTHQQIFGLATNLQWVRGGLKLMRETMNKFNIEGKTQYSENNFAALTYAYKVKYLPTNLANFSPYAEDKQYLNVLHTQEKVRGSIVQYKPLNVMSLSYAQVQSERIINQFVDDCSMLNFDDRRKFGLAKFVTGLGKTEVISSLENVVLAFPTHDLKNEVALRMKHTNFKVTPECPVFDNKDFNDILNNFWSNDLYSQASGFMKRIASSLKHVLVEGMKLPKTDADRDYAQQYILDNKEISKFTGTILTTHTRALFGNFPNHETIIFDEDPMDKVLQVSNFEIDPSFTSSNVSYQSMITSINNKMVSLEDNYVVETDLFVSSLSSDTNKFADFINWLALSNKLDIIKLISSDYIQKSVDTLKNNVTKTTYNHIVKHDLPNKNILILSATASEFIWSRINSNIEVNDLTNVKHVGKINQYSNRSFSKTSLRTISQDQMDSLNEVLGQTPVITFKDMKSKFNNAVSDLHFGNCSGSDSLKGKDIAVVGTFNRPAFVYALFASVLDIKVKPLDLVVEMRTVEYKGLRFKFNTFDNKELQNIHFSLIEGDLIQAVGRARALREDCKVSVYSNFPLFFANTFNFGKNNSLRIDRTIVVKDDKETINTYTGDQLNLFK